MPVQEDRFIRLMTKWFGGTTVLEGMGTWVDDEGQVHTEQVNLITSYISDADMVNTHLLTETFHTAMMQAGEKASMYVLNGEAVIK